MTCFKTYEAARVHSEMIRQGDVSAATVAYTAAATTGRGDVTGTANATHKAAIRSATARHYDRLAAAGEAFGVENGSTGDQNALHAVAWIASGVAHLEPAPAPAAGG